jgi:phenylacetate-coenzyme A ligase PaaK-like adenylate-forming protein
MGHKDNAQIERIFLEEWLSTRVRNQLQNNAEPGLSPGGSPPKRITKSDIDNYRLFKLRETLSYVYDNASFYKELFDTHRIKPEQIRALSDLQRIPFTEQADLAENPNRFLCVSHRDIARVTTFTTSGTTGPEKRIYCTAGDIRHITEFMGAGMRTVTGKQDVVQLMLPSGAPSNQADLLEQGVLLIGARAVKAGLNLTSEEQLALIKKHGTTVVFGVASAVYRMTQELKGRHDLDSLGIKTIFLTNYLADTQRDYLGQLWNCDVHRHYGLTEMGLGVAVECHAHEGYHFNEADLILEVIDPLTGRVLTEGEGELVFTTITREGTPLIRYRTNDFARLMPDPCPCGAATLLRFGPVTKKTELMVTVMSGHVLYPSLFEDVLYKCREVVDYDLRVTNKNCRDRLHFAVEAVGASDGIKRTIKKLLYEDAFVSGVLKEDTMEEPEITIVRPCRIKQMGRAKKKIIDERSSGELR